MKHKNTTHKIKKIENIVFQIYIDIYVMCGSKANLIENTGVEYGSVVQHKRIQPLAFSILVYDHTNHSV